MYMGLYCHCYHASSTQMLVLFLAGKTQYRDQSPQAREKHEKSVLNNRCSVEFVNANSFFKEINFQKNSFSNYNRWQLQFLLSSPLLRPNNDRVSIICCVAEAYFSSTE